MTVTVGILTKNVEKMLESLTPVERARYLSGEWWRLAEKVSSGKNVTAKERDLETIESRYIMSMGAVDFIRYYQERYNLDTRECGKRFIYSYLAGLEQQDALISLLMYEMDHTEYNEYLKPEKIKDSTEWKEEQERLRHMIVVLQERKRVIAKEIKDLLVAEFWEIRNIERPMMESFEQNNDCNKCYR